MTLTQGLRPSAILNRPVPEPWEPSLTRAGARTRRSPVPARTLGATPCPEAGSNAGSPPALIANRHLHEGAVVTKSLVLSEDFGDGLIRRSDHQVSARATALIELRARQRRPAALGSSAVTRSIGRP